MITFVVEAKFIDYETSYPDTPSGDPVAVSLKVLKKHF